MTELVNKCLLARDKFMPEIYLRQPRITYRKNKNNKKNQKKKKKKIKKQKCQDIFINTD